MCWAQNGLDTICDLDGLGWARSSVRNERARNGMDWALAEHGLGISLACAGPGLGINCHLLSLTYVDWAWAGLGLDWLVLSWACEGRPLSEPSLVRVWNHLVKCWPGHDPCWHGISWAWVWYGLVNGWAWAGHGLGL
jgi:hypothetical protein